MRSPCSRRFIAALTSAFILAAGCSEDSTSPRSPESTAADLSTAASATTLLFRQVSAGYLHTCATTTDNRGYCWGRNELGQLGDGTNTHRSRPTPVAGNRQYRVIDAGASSTCGITTASSLYCWGAAIHLSGASGFRQVSVGVAHACGVRADGKAYCWGDNTYGQLGDNTTEDRSVPTAVAGGRQFRQVTVGYYHSCGVTPANLGFCWGRDNSGQLGDGVTNPLRLVPRRIAGGHLFRQLDAGFEHTCAVTTDNRGFCWGSGGLGELGNGSSGARYTPTAIEGELQIESITAGTFHTCAVVTGNQVYCWGVNNQGEVGNGSTDHPIFSPVLAAMGRRLTQVAAGDDHTCGVNANAAAFCWGSNADGGLGIGRFGGFSTMPMRVVSP